MADLKEKLEHIRFIRAAKLASFDNVFKEFMLDDAPKKSKKQLRDFRQLLLDITEPFKDFENNALKKLALENLDVDKMEWPAL